MKNIKCFYNALADKLDVNNFDGVIKHRIVHQLIGAWKVIPQEFVFIIAPIQQ